MTARLEDEKRVFALISAIETNRDRLRHGIDALRQIHNRWKDSKDASINLIAQLTALKSNLGNIQNWLNYAIHDLHPQLLADLDLLTSSCDMLVRHVDALNRRLEQPDPGVVDFAAKLKYVVASRSMERLQKVAQRQNDAVTLLLAACHCNAQAQRKILLHKSRQIRKEDAANLRTLSQSSKWNGGCITGLAQLSRLIQWLRLIYHMKLSRDRLDQDLSEDEDAVAAVRSKAIDRALQEDATTLQRETKLVLAGTDCRFRDLIMHQMKVLYTNSYYSTQERRQYRSAVFSVVRSLIHSTIALLRDTGIALPADLNRSFAILLHEEETADQERITPEAVTAIEHIWSSPQFSALYLQNFEIGFPQCAAYFVQEAPRIASNDYIPSEADILRLHQHVRGIGELRFNWDELDVHLFNVNYVHQQFVDRWFHQFEGATAFIYTVDVSIYDQPFAGRAGESLLVNEFEGFERWVNKPGFANSCVILILNNFTRFMEKMAHSPLEKFFPDYVPNECDPELSARQYILRRFKNMNRQGLFVYSFWVDLHASDNQHLYTALKKTLARIQERKARNEIWNADMSARESSRPSTNGLSSILSTSRSFSRKKEYDE
ncbi:hypothetical protein BDW02DRAFT_509719 [Decorospora gaudefroyi]|uniref:Uncharacterized protein n=1 Tax=Decorospora gaudefroyi TaxID=184978 RepID=A0A6A5JXG4_9PLEO|nr:hypothetical protein BDW02DRAFT_509719 [Decorospora gaudefroyi]